MRIQAYEIERKYRFFSLPLAEQFFRQPNFLWRKIGILQWYLNEKEDTDLSIRIRLTLKKDEEGFKEEWEIGSKRPVPHHPEQRVETQTSFSFSECPSDVALTLEEFGVKLPGDLDRYPVVAKIRYIMVKPLKIVRVAEVVLDHFIYPIMKRGERVHLELELRDKTTLPGQAEQFESLFGRLNLYTFARDITSKTYLSNRSLAERAFEEGKCGFGIEMGRMEIERLLSAKEPFGR